MSFMTFQKYICNGALYLLFDSDMNEEALSSEAFWRISNSNIGSCFSGIIFGFSSKTVENPDFIVEKEICFWDVKGQLRKATEDVLSVFNSYWEEKHNPDYIPTNAIP